MKQIKFLSVILTLTIMSCSSVPETNQLCYDLVEDLGKQYLKEKLYSGSCYTVYPGNDEAIDEIRSYRKGIMHGVWAKYYQNGQIQYIGRAKKGDIDGKYKLFRENGLLSEEGSMKKGHKDKVWKYYNLAGDLEKTELYENKFLIDEFYTNPTIQKKLNENK